MGVVKMVYVCKCGFKCDEGQLAKTEGFCPKCNEGRADMLAKHSKASYTKKGGA